MIMPRGQQLLLPANPLFVLSTLIAALFANMVANISMVGNAAWMPDFLALVLVPCITSAWLQWKWMAMSGTSR